MGALFTTILGLIYLALVIYMITLASRFVCAVEQIASKFNRG